MSRPTRSARAVLVRSLIGAIVVAALAWPAVTWAVSLTLPKGITEQQAKQMYAEQLDSQSNINGLVRGQIVSFEVTGRVVKASTAELQVSVVDRSGVARRGVMRFLKADNKWYFSSISREGMEDEAVSSTARYDVGVLNTILSEQTAHADATAKLVDGTYTKVTVGKRKPGYRSVVLPVVFSGAAKVAPANGEITAVRRMSAGSSKWFVVSFDAK